MTDAEIRDWLKSNVQPCPCCGAGVVIRVDTDERGNSAFRELKAADTLIALVPAEQAEDELREIFGRPADPVGGRT